MPLAPTVPVVQPSLSQLTIFNVAIQVEPALVVAVIYGPSDAAGNQTGPTSTVQFGAPALAALGLTKAKFYAALQAHIPALAGTVT